MNVLMISDVYFPRINGVSTSIETFRHDLHALGVDTTLVSPEYPAAMNIADVATVRIPSRYLPLDPEDRIMKLGEIRKWAENYAGPAFDLIHIQTPFVAHYAGLELARRFGVPAIATYHTYFEEYLHHYVPFVPRPFMRAAARRFSRGQCNALNALIVPSRAMAEALRDYGINTPLHVLPTGLPEDRYNKGDGAFFRARYDLPVDRPLLLFVGRVAHEKNIGFLVDVIDRVRMSRPDAMLLITGEGPASNRLRTTVRERRLDEHVRFLGYLDRHRELADCYAAADIFVFASRTETQGLVLLEAMAAGAPVVALSVMGTRDILEPAQGAVIARDDVDDFASKVVELLKNNATRARLAEEARCYALRWNAAAMAQQLAQLYENIQRGRPADSIAPSGDQGPRCHSHGAAGAAS